MPSISISQPHFLSLHKNPTQLFFSSNSFPNSIISRSRKLSFFASVPETKTQASWLCSHDHNDRYGGWSFTQFHIPNNYITYNKKGYPKFVIACVGASFATIIAVTAQFSLSHKGFRFHFNVPLHALHSVFVPFQSKGNVVSSVESDACDKNEDTSTMSHVALDIMDEGCGPASGEKLKRVIIPVYPDSVQEEALSVLKKLKIIEDDVKSDELCTRREYARWLVRAIALLERIPKFRMVPSILLAGSTAAAFDDISVGDPDFWCIQSLAEAGIVPSKLLPINSCFVKMAASESSGRVEFNPESHINRFDLVKWKAQLEYALLPGMEDEISMKKVGFVDMKDLTPATSPELFMDLLAGDKRNSRRLQPLMPATTAQAAIALTCGRMAEAIRAELLSIEAENLSKQAEAEEIRTELLLKGEIQRFWAEKMNVEKARGLEVERDFLAAKHDLGKGKLVLDEGRCDFIQEKAALECQQQLLQSLKEEVDEMREKLPAEKASFTADKQALEKLALNLQADKEAVTERKSALEAEIEALRILRSWVENEARQSHFRAKVLEQAGRRWKWDGN